MKIVVVGGGAAGFFAALAAKELNQNSKVIILERSAKLLSKVRISGGGRCNVTHACFDPKLLVQNYPRGSKELIGPFHRFQPRDTIDWFRERGVELKVEQDGRIFPTTDSSETIVQCLVRQAEYLGIEVCMNTKLSTVLHQKNQFELTIGASCLKADRLILATGSAKEGWEIARYLGHTIQPPVPSLFSLNIPSFPLVDLAGVSQNLVKVQFGSWAQEGVLLITHWGFSGPALLKLSAFAARDLASHNYQGVLVIDWLPEHDSSYWQALLVEYAKNYPQKYLGNLRLGSLSKNLLKKLCEYFGYKLDTPLHAITRKLLYALVERLKKDPYPLDGKTTNKEEFVTCGGVTRSEVHFQTMESKKCPGLFFCGEVLDIDGVTGGFNFQNAWTTGWIAGRAAAELT